MLVSDSDRNCDYLRLATFQGVVGGIAGVEGPLAVAAQGQAGYVGGGAEAQGCTVVDVIGSDFAIYLAITFGGRGSSSGDGGAVVHAGDGDGQRVAAGERTVGSGEVDGQGGGLAFGQVLVVGVARVQSPGAIGIQGEAARYGTNCAVSQGVAVDVSGGQLAADFCSVLDGSSEGLAGYWCVIHRADNKGDAVTVAQLAVGGVDGQGVLAVVVLGRGVLQALQCGVDSRLAALQGDAACAVAAEDQTVGDNRAEVQYAVLDGEGGGQLVAVHVAYADAVAAQQTEGLAAIFVKGLCAWGGVDRGIVDRGNLKGKCGGAAEVAIAQGVSDGRYRAVVVLGRGEGEITVGLDGQLANKQVCGVAGLEADEGQVGQAELGDGQAGAGVVDVGVVGQHVAGGCVVFQQGDLVGHAHWAIIAAVDGDGDAGLGAVSGGDLEGFGVLVADVQLVVGGAGGVSPLAIGADIEGAVGAGDVALGDEGGWAVDIADGQGAVGGQRGVGLGQLHVGAAEDGRVVGAVDGNGNAALGAVGAGDREGFAIGLVDVQLVEGRVGDIGPVAGGIDTEGAVGADDAALDVEGGGAVDIADGQGAASAQRDVGLGQLHVGAAEDGRVVHPCDSDGQGVAAGGAVFVGDVVVDGDGDGRVFSQGLVSGVAGVEGPTAVGIQGEAGWGLAIHCIGQGCALVGVGGHQVAGDAGVFGDGRRGRGGDRGVVGAGEINGDDAGVAGAGGVLHGYGEVFAGVLVQCQAVHCRGVDDIGVAAVSVDGQFAIGAFGAAAPGKDGVIYVGGGQLALDVGESVVGGGVVDAGFIGAASDGGVVDRVDANVDGQRG